MEHKVWEGNCESLPVQSQSQLKFLWEGSRSSYYGNEQTGNSLIHRLTYKWEEHARETNCVLGNLLSIHYHINCSWDPPRGISTSSGSTLAKNDNVLPTAHVPIVLLKTTCVSLFISNQLFRDTSTIPYRVQPLCIHFKPQFEPWILRHTTLHPRRQAAKMRALASSASVPSSKHISFQDMIITKAHSSINVTISWESFQHLHFF